MKYNAPLFLVTFSISFLTMEAIGSFLWATEMPGWGFLFATLFALLAFVQFWFIEPGLKTLSEENRELFWGVSIVSALVVGTIVGLIMNLPSLAIDPPLSGNQSFSDSEKGALVASWAWTFLAGGVTTLIAIFRPRRLKKTPKQARTTRIYIPVDPRLN